MFDLAKIGKFIAECRKKKGITQKDLAEQLDSAESFSKKAEENIMELMKTNKNVCSKSKWSLIGGIAG